MMGGLPAVAHAQRIEIERADETERAAPSDETPESNEASRADGTSAEDDDEESSGSTPAPGIPRFDDVADKRIRPGDLPPPVSNDIPSVLKKGTENLPSPPSNAQLEETAGFVRERVFEVVAIQTPEVPNTSSKIVHRGHAVWLATTRETRPPVLLTTFFWLSKAHDLYIVPPDADIQLPESDVPEAERRTLDDVTVQPGSEEWLESRRGDLVPAKLYKPDKHRNLVTIVPESPDALELPMPPLGLLDFDRETPVRLYGHSPKMGSGLVQTQIPASHPDSESLAYYLQTPFRAPFGAPIVNADGHVLAMTAFLHPEDAETTLVVPPAPIRAYLEEIQTEAP